MSTLAKMNEEAARALFESFAPMFRRFEDEGIDYCLVGGLAIVAHCLAQGSNRLRATTDADLLVPQDYSNQDFAMDYLSVYAATPEASRAVYDALLGNDGFEQLGAEDSAFVNISFVGADIDLDGIDTPDFDICRSLNGRSIGTIRRQRLTVCGFEIWVATIPELLKMKQDTINLYGGDPVTYPRQQDFIDVGTLETLNEYNDYRPSEKSALLKNLRRHAGGKR